MAARTKIFRNGGSQAVRLPVDSVGRHVVSEPADEWSAAFRHALGAWREKIERPPSKKLSKLRDPNQQNSIS